MDNKITKERIGVHLEYDWLKYILLLIAGIVIFYMIFSQINRTRDFEDINVFFSNYRQTVPTQNADYLNYLKTKYGDAYIREANINYQSPTGNEYSTLYSTHGLTSDALVLGRSYMLGNGYGYMTLTPEILALILPEGTTEADYEYFTYTEADVENGYAHKDLIGRRYGIRVDNLKNIGTDPKTAAFVFDPAALELEGAENMDSEFYLCINPAGLNIGPYNQKAKNRERYADCLQTFYYAEYFLQTFGPGLAG
ncbi:MAG: hypothetical protein LBH24_02120 [Clostridiales bacterium]|nr:hypothetical protein [Clostridiales bacterium]